MWNLLVRSFKQVNISTNKVVISSPHFLKV